MLNVDNVVPIIEDQGELFPGWRYKTNHFSLTSARSLPLDQGELAHSQHVEGSWVGVVKAVHLNGEKRIYDIQVLEATVET